MHLHDMTSWEMEIVAALKTTLLTFTAYFGIVSDNKLRKLKTVMDRSYTSSVKSNDLSTLAAIRKEAKLEILVSKCTDRPSDSNDAL